MRTFTANIRCCSIVKVQQVREGHANVSNLSLINCLDYQVGLSYPLVGAPVSCLKRDVDPLADSRGPPVASAGTHGPIPRTPTHTCPYTVRGITQELLITQCFNLNITL